MTINDNKENLGGKSCHLSQLNDNKKNLRQKKKCHLSQINKRGIICHKLMITKKNKDEKGVVCHKSTITKKKKKKTPKTKGMSSSTNQ